MTKYKLYDNESLVNLFECALSDIRDGGEDALKDDETSQHEFAEGGEAKSDPAGQNDDAVAERPEDGIDQIEEDEAGDEDGEKLDEAFTEEDAEYAAAEALRKLTPAIGRAWSVDGVDAGYKNAFYFYLIQSKARTSIDTRKLFAAVKKLPSHVELVAVDAKQDGRMVLSFVQTKL